MKKLAMFHHNWVGLWVSNEVAQLQGKISTLRGKTLSNSKHGNLAVRLFIGCGSPKIVQGDDDCSKNQHLIY